MNKLHVNERTGETEDMYHSDRELVIAEHHSPKNRHFWFYSFFTSILHF